MENQIKKLHLGVIGVSEGNGHPYSWSAIFNGYNPEAMEECGFPVIPRYLEKQQFPEDAITLASVTHIWAQDKEIAQHIAKAALIETVVKDFTDMIGHIDGLLLARDDAENHEDFAAPFLDAGIPIYIDKPLALSVIEAQRMFNRQRYEGQLFSCSALKYAEELKLSNHEIARVGKIRYIQALVPKDWDKYAIHAIEPVLQIAGDYGNLVSTRVFHDDDITMFNASFSNRLNIQISALGSIPAPISIKVFGESGWVELTFQNTFKAFKCALEDFVLGIIHHDVRSSPEIIISAIKLVESGRRQ